MTHTSEHRINATARLSAVGKRYFHLIEFDDDEELVLEIRKHPFGLLLIVAGGLIISLVVALIPMLLAFVLDDTDAVTSGQSLATAQQLLVIAGLILGFGALVVTGINTILYRNNVIFVTSEKIAQVLYLSLFNRKISQLSIGDIQDVTVAQNGIFPNLLGYGSLVVETAGEQQNYTFTFVPKPYESARSIVGSHELNLRKYGN